MKKKHERLEEIFKLILNDIVDSRPFSSSIHTASGWEDGSQDVVILVQKGSPAKNVIILDVGNKYVRHIRGPDIIRTYRLTPYDQDYYVVKWKKNIYLANSLQHLRLK